jgi:hypothetical protein
LLEWPRASRQATTKHRAARDMHFWMGGSTMRSNDLLLVLLLVLRSSLVAVLITACGSSQKPFDQMTAQEHREAAARENQLADENFERITGENIEPPETLPTGEVYNHLYAESGGAIPYTYAPGPADPEGYTAWPRVSDPSEKYEDAASRHRENALRHERAAAALEGRPSPQPLPPDRG